MTELVLDSPVAPASTPVATPVAGDTVLAAAALTSIDSPSPGDIFFNHTGSKILVLDMLLESVRCFQSGSESNLAYEKDWLLGIEDDCAISGPLCFTELGGDNIDPHTAAINFIAAAEKDPRALTEALRLARCRVRSGDFELSDSVAYMQGPSADARSHDRQRAAG